MKTFEHSKETQFDFTASMLRKARQDLGKAITALKRRSPGAAIGSLLAAQSTIASELVSVGAFVGRHQGKWPRKKPTK